MSNPRNALQSMFTTANRYSNFGEMLVRIKIHGIRCHRDTIIEIESPITAFCGINGTGKSTILQLAAAAYKGTSSANSPTFYIKDFLVVGTLDPKPFDDDAYVEFRYWQNNSTFKTLTISRNASTKRWQGYKRRPERPVLFAGVGIYLPKVEQRDFIVREASQLMVSSRSIVANDVKEWTCKVLGQTYDNITSNTVTHSQRTGQVISVQRSNVIYSESHMGFGEGRSQYLIHTLETIPERSLVLIEEPETSLHPHAQYEFGSYLVDVVMRRRHQILLSTHSEFILEALPSKSRIYLNRTANGITIIPGLKVLQAKSLMAQGHVKALYILVEDECAKTVLCEILRRTDPDFLRSVEIVPTGDTDLIAKTIRALKSTGLSVVAVRDGDKNGAPRENIFKLPGSYPPEKELFACQAVKDYIQETYALNLDDFVTSLSGVDHHDWFPRLADYINQDKSALVSEASRAYARNLPESEVETLTMLLKEAIRR
ncbi:ATP-dependent nuclease [Neomoorella thermoacetica]|uniref:ATP-dependent nuclease n=1 Tax=Neomoorella thermoacetica TaxID=1525 RepID=UPI0009083B61|nr:AAA family ATPase [Moorella thermoacetica]APC07756.1 hypothetical protein MTJW_05860 [Moorella thermoacetica]OIQ53539.1 hypothetical protein MORE_18910 [Moorella thermoacetica]